MIKYLENRIWSLNSKIINTETNEQEINDLLNQHLANGWFASEGLLFSYTPNPVGNYSFRQTELTLEFSTSCLLKFQQLLDEKEIPLLLTSFQMLVNTFGFLNIIPIYDFKGTIQLGNISAVEEAGDAAAEIIDSLFDEISTVVDALHAIGIIQKSSFYHFGLPSGIEKYGVHTKDDSYNYLAHIFYFDKQKELSQTIKHYQTEENRMTYEDHSFYPVFPMYYWEMGKNTVDKELIKLISIDSYLLCETVAINNALHVYNSFLDVLNQNKEVDSNHLRKIFNYNTWLIQSLRLFNPNFTIHQFRFMKMYRQNSDIATKYELLKDAEQSLTFAIEGIEVSRTQKSERVMQFILALFTALTLYSVITDVFALITSDVESVPFSMTSLQSIIFLIETTVIISFIIFFRRISNKL